MMFDFLLNSEGTKAAVLVPTTCCNLKCIYCAASQPNYSGQELDRQYWPLVIEQLVSRGVRSVSVNGHGETTVYPYWQELCKDLLSQGIGISINSNLSKNFLNCEIELLASMSLLVISSDTTDPTLHAQLRSGSCFSRMLSNFDQIVELKERINPELIFKVHIVVSNQNVFDLPKTVRFWIGKGVSVFALINLVEYPYQGGELVVKHVVSLGEKELNLAYEAVRSALEIIEKSGCKADHYKSLLQQIEIGLGIFEDSDDYKEQLRLQREQSRLFPNQISGRLTRECFDPWNICMIEPDLAVRPCCVQPPLGNLKDANLSWLLSGEEIKKLRYQLITGELSEKCGNCHLRGLIKTEDFARKLAADLSESAKS